MHRNFFLILALVGCSGCLKVKDKGQDEGPGDRPVAQSLSLSQVSSNLIPGDEAFQYKAQFYFHTAVSGVFVNKTVDGEKSGRWVSVLNQMWLDTVTAGQVVEYELGNFEGDRFQVWHSVKWPVPEDLVVDQVVDIEDQEFHDLFAAEPRGLTLRKFRRLFLTENGQIILRDKSVRIEVDQLHSQGGKILTFPAEAEAPVGKKGRSGGQIEIHAVKAVGTLFIELRGEKGGQGLPGEAADIALKGITGLAGKEGASTTSICERGEGCISKQLCHIQPQRGMPGGQGSRGYRGYDGARGGNSGRLLMEIIDSTEFTFQGERFAGEGGAGGIGGPGGEGGDGGPQGQVVGGFGVGCDTPGSGPRGPQGIRGEPGQNGLPGQQEWICEMRDQKKNCY